MTCRIAVFISSHGFGHAARTLAVMAELKRRLAAVHFLIHTTVPAWFFRDELGDACTVREILADVGFSQADPFTVDLADTVRRLDRLLPYNPDLIRELARDIAGCLFVLADIAPLGILVAEQAGLESVLLENFTWDFLYAGYLRQEPRLASFIRRFAGMFGRATVRIATEPLCAASPSDSFVANPISRKPRLPPGEIRAQLRIPAGRRVVLVSFGGISGEVLAPEMLARLSPDTVFLSPGPYDKIAWREKVLLLPYRSGFGHADLMAAADAVILKAGYSTLAEAFHAGVPVGYALRDDFPESPGLERFIRAMMPAARIPQHDLGSGRWLSALPELFALGRRKPGGENGREQVAAFLIARYGLSPSPAGED